MQLLCIHFLRIPTKSRTCHEIDQILLKMRFNPSRILKISMSGSETNCSCLGFRDRGSAGGGVMGAGDRVVMLRIFFWNLSFSLTPALGGARAQI